MALIRRVRVVWTGVAGTPAYSNLFFDNSAGGIVEMHTAVAAFIGSLRPHFHPSVTATVESEVPLIDTTTGDITGVDTTPIVVHSGTGATEMLPRANQILVRWATDAFVGGRRVRGRFFLPYVVESTNNGGSVESSTQVGIQTNANILLTDAEVRLVVWSRKAGVAPAVTSSSVWGQFAQLRSRRD